MGMRDLNLSCAAETMPVMTNFTIAELAGLHSEAEYVADAQTGGASADQRIALASVAALVAIAGTSEGIREAKLRGDQRNGYQLEAQTTEIYVTANRITDQLTAFTEGLVNVSIQNNR